MSYKTILLHCNDQRRIARLLSPTLALADRFQSHVIALSVVPPISVITTGARRHPSSLTRTANSTVATIRSAARPWSRTTSTTPNGPASASRHSAP